METTVGLDAATGEVEDVYRRDYHEGVPLDDGGFLVVGGFGGDVSAETYRVGGDH